MGVTFPGRAAPSDEVAWEGGTACPGRWRQLGLLGAACLQPVGSGARLLGGGWCWRQLGLVAVPAPRHPRAGWGSPARWLLLAQSRRARAGGLEGAWRAPLKPAFPGWRAAGEAALAARAGHMAQAGAAVRPQI